MYLGCALARGREFPSGGTGRHLSECLRGLSCRQVGDVMKKRPHGSVVHAHRLREVHINAQRKSGIRILDYNVSAICPADYLTSLRFVADHWIWSVPTAMLVFGGSRAVIVDQVTRFVKPVAICSGLGLQCPVDLGNGGGLCDRLDASLADAALTIAVGVLSFDREVGIIQIR